jgi:hypothetical protein
MVLTPGSSFTIGLVGTLIGAAAALAAVVLRHKLDTRRRKRVLRSSLLSEIRSTEWLTEDYLGDLKRNLNERGAVHSHVPTSVYDGCDDKLGLLNEDERQKVIDYYTYAHIASEQLSEVRRDQGDVTNLVEGTLDTMVSRREGVVEALEDNL